MGASGSLAWLYAATIFTSAFLLFLVQPIMAKQILPWFGGSAAVWSVCMVFFQVTLLAGYAYADVVVRKLAPRTQAVLHTVLLVLGLATLPILAADRWKPAPGDEPTLLILALLVATIGLPYFLLSTTGPLLQAWLARAPWASRVYRYFSLSNFASLLALLAYPAMLEPVWPLRTQALVWSAGFGAFALLAVAVAWHAARLPLPDAPRSNDDNAATHAVEAPHRPWLWLALPAMGSWLLLAVTNHLTQHVASVPFLWVLPLVTYLVTFILCFESDRWYRRRVFVPLAIVSLIGSAALLTKVGGQHLSVGLPVFTAALFVLCMVLHGETARLKPAPRYLTRFYLMLSAGGALGGAFVGLVAPVAFDGNYEFGLGLFLVAMLGVAVYAPPRGARAATTSAVAVLAPWLSLGVAIACAAFLYQQARIDRLDARVLERNFYGTLQTYDTRGDANPKDARRILLHGSIKHGEQFLAPERAREPTSYYAETSGIGRVLRGLPADKPARVGLIGLGAGTLAVYARAGDVYRLYELDPDVFDVARREFTYLRDMPAKVEDVVGDARLSMEREAPQALDVLAVDAFSGGSVPVHLLTLQALDVYLKHLAPRGVIAFHLTNRHLDMRPVVLAAARERGLNAVVVRDKAEQSELLQATTWLLIAREPDRLRVPSIAEAADSSVKPAARAWTDDFNDLLSILK